MNQVLTRRNIVEVYDSTGMTNLVIESLNAALAAGPIAEAARDAAIVARDQTEVMYDGLLTVYDAFPHTADQFRVLTTVDGQTDVTIPYPYPVAAPDNVMVSLDSFDLPHGDGWTVPTEDLDETSSTTIRLTEGVPAGTEISGAVKKWTLLPQGIVPWSNVTGKPALVPERFAPYRVLAFADPQPLPEFVTEWQGILDGIAADGRTWDDVLFAGDLVDYGAPDGRPSYAPNAYTLNDAWDDLSSRLGVTATNFMAVAGNHDNNYGQGSDPGRYRFDNWERVIGPRCWARRRGNLLIIGLSPTSRSTTGFYAAPEVAWMRDLVRRNQDCTIVCMTHHPLNNTFISADPALNMNGVINNTARDFTWVNTEGHRVDLWISGHQGNQLDDEGNIIGDPATPQDGFIVASAWNNLRCLGLNLPPSKPDADPPAAKSVCYLRFDDEASQIAIERVNVPQMTTREVYTVPLRGPSRVTGTVQMDTRFDKSDTQPRWGTGYNVVEYDRAPDGSLVGGIKWAQTFALTDNGNDNVSAGDGVGVMLAVPGMAQYSVSDPPPPPHLEKLAFPGAGIAAIRKSGAEINRTSNLGLFASVYNPSTGDGGLDATPTFEVSSTTIISGRRSLGVALASPIGVPADPGYVPPDYTFRQSEGGPQLVVISRRETGGGVNFAVAGAVMKVAFHESGRSINAGGTINASGADVAEYFRRCDRMVSAGLFVPKGAIVGLDATGCITDRWDEVATGCLIKSTAPNLVGNDAWGAEVNLCAKYGLPPAGEMPDENNNPAAYAAWRARSSAIRAAYETERPLWDRLALCGQVPTLIDATSADVGKWLIPVQDGTGIGAAKISDAMLTFDQYKRRLGRIVTIADGKAVALVGVM